MTGVQNGIVAVHLQEVLLKKNRRFISLCLGTQKTVTHPSHLRVGAHGVMAVGMLALVHRLRVDNLDVLGQIRFPDAARIALAALQGLILKVAIPDVGGQRAGRAAGHVAHGALVAIYMPHHVAL